MEIDRLVDKKKEEDEEERERVSYDCVQYLFGFFFILLNCNVTS